MFQLFQDEVKAILEGVRLKELPSCRRTNRRTKQQAGGTITDEIPQHRRQRLAQVHVTANDQAGVKTQRIIEYVANKLDYNLYSPSSVGRK